MSTSSNYVYTVTLDAGGVNTTLAGMESRLQSATGKVSGLQGAFDRIGKAAFAFVNISDSIDRMMSSLDDFSGPGMALNSQMHELSAITGVTGKRLKEIEDYARDAAKTFGGSAADSVEAYKLVLSQLGPEIAQVPEALAAMGDSIKTTSKLMGGDTTAAAEVLTTALNQYKVSLDDPIKASEEMARMMNVMAAAGQAGSAELPAIKEALEQTGMVAKTAGISFEETNAAIQMLDKAGKKGSEGGVALRNVMTTLMQGRFLPKDVQEELASAGVSTDTLADQSLSLADRLRGLGPVMNDQALMAKLFGRENVAAALALISSINPMEELTAAISGSNSAYEQAGIIMESDAEKMSRFQARIDDLKISLYNVYHGILPAVKGMGSAIQTVANLAVAANAIHTLSEMALAKSIRSRVAATWTAVSSAYAGGGALGIFSAAAVVAKIACHGLAVGIKAIGKAIFGIPIVGWIAAIVAVIIKGISLLWQKSEGFRRLIFGTFEALKAVFHNIGVFFGTIWENGLKPVFQGIGNAFARFWDGLRQFFGRIGIFFTGIRDGIVNVFNRILEPIRGILNRLKGIFREAFDRIVEWIARPFQWIKEMWNKLFPDDKFEDVGDAFKSGQQKGSESFRKDNPERDPDTPPVVPVVAGPSVMQDNELPAFEQPKSAPSRTQTSIDLSNVKASTDYSAVAARLKPKIFSGLRGGKVAETLSTPATSGSAAVTPMPSFLEQPEDRRMGLLQRIANDVSRMAAGITIAALPSGIMAEPVRVSDITPVEVDSVQPATQGGRTARFEKFCEKIEINVPAGTTAQQAEAIMAEIMRRINDAVE